MADERPGNLAIPQLRNTDLAREGAIRLIEDVLGRDLDALAEMLAAEKEVEGGRGDDDFCCACVSFEPLDFVGCGDRWERAERVGRASGSEFRGAW